MLSTQHIRRGRMTVDDKAKIERLAATMKKPSAGKIARQINRHPATVNWFLLTRGLIERKAGHAKKPYIRRGKLVQPYSAEQDARIEALRVLQKTFSEIAAAISEEFGIERTAHSVQVRLVQITASPTE